MICKSFIYLHFSPILFFRYFTHALIPHTCTNFRALDLANFKQTHTYILWLSPSFSHSPHTHTLAHSLTHHTHTLAHSLTHSLSNVLQLTFYCCKLKGCNSGKRHQPLWLDFYLSKIDDLCFSPPPCICSFISPFLLLLANFSLDLGSLIMQLLLPLFIVPNSKAIDCFPCRVSQGGTETCAAQVKLKCEYVKKRPQRVRKTFGRKGKKGKKTGSAANGKDTQKLILTVRNETEKAID